jgi:glycosyltransferase involved in cell wall biosynthesis
MIHEGLRLRILFLPEYFLPHIGGGEIWCWNVARNLAKKHEITVLTYKHPERRASEIIDNVNIVRMGPFPIPGVQPYLTRAFIQIPFSLIHSMKRDFDIVLANQTLPLSLGKIVSLLKRKPLVSIFHDVYGLEFSLRDKGLVKGMIRGSLEVLSLRLKYDAVIAVSDSVKEKLIDWGVSENRIHVVYGGVDLSIFDRVEEKRSEAPVVLYVGRLVRLKRVDLLIKSFSKVIKDFPNASLWIVGDGPERASLERMAEQYNIPVKFMGWIDGKEKIRVMKKAWCLILPSEKEGLGLVLLESMACKTPVVAVDSGGPRAVVKDEVNGFLVPPGSEDLIYERICRILSDEKLRDRMGEAGRKIVEEKFTWERVAERVEKVLLSVLQTFTSG